MFPEQPGIPVTATSEYHVSGTREIPYGGTVRCSQLAERIGQSDSARAVAAALGKNPLPLVIPCHRVTYSDGRLGGFSAAGGVQLKRRMLDLERRVKC